MNEIALQPAYRADVEAAFGEMAEVFFFKDAKVFCELASQLCTSFSDAFAVIVVGPAAASGIGGLGDGLTFGVPCDSAGFDAAAITGPTADG